MKIFAAVMALLLGGAGIASAQDDPNRKLDELRRDMERSMKGLQQKFEAERERLEQEFKAARQKLLERKEEPKKDEKPRDVESLLRDLLQRVDSLEKKLDQQMPKLHELPRLLPKDPSFDFKRFQNGVPDEWRRWLEQMPRFRGGEDFRFEFKKQDPKKEMQKKSDD